MIIRIHAPDYLQQFILNHTKGKDEQKDWIDTASNNSLEYFLLSHFRRPKGDEYMPELQQGLKIRVSNKLKLEKRIFLSPTAQKVFLSQAQKMFKDDFRSYMADLFHKDAFVVSTIKIYLESRNIEYSHRLYEMLSKDFYRWKKKQLG